MDRTPTYHYIRTNRYEQDHFIHPLVGLLGLKHAGAEKAYGR